MENGVVTCRHSRAPSHHSEGIYSTTMRTRRWAGCVGAQCGRAKCYAMHGRAPAGGVYAIFLPTSERCEY